MDTMTSTIHEMALVMNASGGIGTELALISITGASDA